MSSEIILHPSHNGFIILEKKIKHTIFFLFPQLSCYDLASVYLYNEIDENVYFTLMSHLI